MYIMRYTYVQFAFNGLMTELHCLFFVHIQEYVYDLCIMFLNEINKDYWKTKMCVINFYILNTDK